MMMKMIFGLLLGFLVISCGNNEILDCIDGCTSKAGTSGANGTSGVDGVDGTSGVDGVDGTSGVDGVDGTSGADGTSGIDEAEEIAEEALANAEEAWANGEEEAIEEAINKLLELECFEFLFIFSDDLASLLGNDERLSEKVSECSD